MPPPFSFQDHRSLYFRVTLHFWVTVLLPLLSSLRFKTSWLKATVPVYSLGHTICACWGKEELQESPSNTKRSFFFSPLFSVEKEMVVTFNAEWGWSTWDKRHATFLHRGVWLCTLTGGVVPIVQKHRFWTRILGRQRLVRPVSLTRLSFVFSRCFSFRFGTHRGHGKF